MRAIELFDIDIDDLIPPDDGAGRTTGCHVSAIIRLIMQGLEPDKYGDGSPTNWVRITIGFAFERMLELGLRALAGTFFRPSELMQDGIYASPDAIRVEGGLLAVEEYKATWKKSIASGLSSDAIVRELDKRFRLWLWQIKAYCYLVGTCTAVLRVFFVNGNYTFTNEGGPKLRCFRLEFEQQELDDCWAMLLREAKAGNLL